MHGDQRRHYPAMGSASTWGHVMSRPPPVTLDIIGPPQQVRNALERAYADGRLVSFTAPTNPIAVVHVRALMLPAHKPSVWQRLYEDPTPILYTAAFVIPAAIVGTVLYVTVSAALAVAAWLALNMSTILGVIALLTLLMFFGGAKACAGLHCGGCKG